MPHVTETMLYSKTVALSTCKRGFAKVHKHRLVRYQRAALCFYAHG